MPPRSVLLLLLLSLFATFTFAKPAWHLIETEDGEGDAELDTQDNEPENKNIAFDANSDDNGDVKDADIGIECQGTMCVEQQGAMLGRGTKVLG